MTNYIRNEFIKLLLRILRIWFPVMAFMEGSNSILMSCCDKHINEAINQIVDLEVITISDGKSHSKEY
jgi:hypothetical protein